MYDYCYQTLPWTFKRVAGIAVTHIDGSLGARRAGVQLVLLRESVKVIPCTRDLKLHPNLYHLYIKGSSETDKAVYCWRLHTQLPGINTIGNINTEDTTKTKTVNISCTMIPYVKLSPRATARCYTDFESLSPVQNATAEDKVTRLASKMS